MAPRSDRSLSAKQAAHARWAIQDPVAGTAAAQAAINDRLLSEIDPDGVLGPEERARRLKHARSAYFARLARRRRKAVDADADLADEIITAAAALLEATTAGDGIPDENNTNTSPTTGRKKEKNQ